MYGKKPKNFKERNKNIKTIYPYTKEHYEISKEFSEKYGRAWWIFQGVKFRPKRKRRTWIEQFRVQDPTRQKKSV